MPTLASGLSGPCTVDDVMAQVRRATQLIGEIGSATRQLTSGIDQVIE